jgi:hypothetical protein
MRNLIHALTVAMAALVFTGSAISQERPDSAKVTAAQREAMKSLAAMDGTWRGTAWTMKPDGTRHQLTQTERVGSFLDGTIKVVEGRGYEADGTVSFNAFAIISYDPSKQAYSMRSYTMTGQKGDFVIEPNATGFVWTIPAGPMTIRYTATIKDGKWREVGERLMPGKDPIQFMEMNLERIGNSDWPGAGAVTAK